MSINVDVYSIIAGTLFGLGIGIVIGYFLGLYAYGRVVKEAYLRIKAVLNIKRG